MYPERSESASIPEFIATWEILPLSDWCVKLDVPADLLITDERLFDPDCDSRPTQLCQKLSRGEAMPSAVREATIAAEAVY